MPPCPPAGAGQARDARAVPSSGLDTLGESEAGAGVLASREDIDVVEAVRRSLETSDVGAAVGAVPASVDAGHRGVVDAEAGVAAVPMSVDDAVSMGVMDAGSVSDPGSRHVLRRVGQSEHRERRLRRGNTLTAPCGHDAIDVPVSQGRLVLDDSDDVDVSGMVTPVAGSAVSEDDLEEGRSPSLDRQAPCYSPPLRRRASKVERPLSPALPPRPAARTRKAASRIDRAGFTAAVGADGGGDNGMAVNTDLDGARSGVMLRGQGDVHRGQASASGSAAQGETGGVRRSARIAAHRDAGAGVASGTVDRVDAGGRGRSAGRRGGPPPQGRGRGQGRR